MTRLFVVRHGQTDWNLANRLQGSSDIPLNDPGRAQASAAATGLLAQLVGMPTVVASTLSRARETAQILFEGWAVQIHEDARIAERSYGVWEGMEADLRQVNHPEDYDRWKAGLEPRIEGYETHAALTARSVAAADEWTARVEASGGGDLVFVSHGSTGRMLLMSLLGLPMQDVAISIIANPDLVEIRNFDIGSLKGAKIDMAGLMKFPGDSVEGSIDARVTAPDGRPLWRLLSGLEKSGKDVGAHPLIRTGGRRDAVSGTTT